MKIQAEKSALQSVLKQAAKIASHRAVMPILSHVAISFDGYACTITANDGNRTYSETFPASGDAGQCTIEADKLARAVSGMKSGIIEITPDQIKQGRSRLKLESRDYDKFPQPDYHDSSDAGITGETLAVGLATVQHAMGQKDVRPMLNGVHLADGYAVATDGHRMAYAELPYKGPAIIIPAESVRQMIEMGGQVMVSERQIIIQSEHSRFSSGLVDARYPDWDRVIPRAFSATATVNVNDLASAISTVRLGQEQASLKFYADRLVIKNEKGESEIDCECTAETETAFSLGYLLDAIQAAATDTVTIQVGESGRASLIECRFVVMPVRL